jgi:arginine deiminase
VNGEHGVGSEVGRLRTVVLHRPGAELRRLTPRNNDDLLFDGVPWLERAQQEHDRFAATLRDDGVEVLYLHELLTEVLEAGAAREQLLDSALRPETIGPTLAPALEEHLAALPAGELAEVLMAGMAREELPLHPGGLVEAMARPRDFVIGPLPNLLFTRDSAVWLENGVAVTQLAMPARRRESAITGAIYRHHPRFAGTELLYGGSLADQAWLEGGDVLALAPGVLAIGVGQRTSPAGVEAFAERLFAAEAAQAVLAVPIAQDRATMHLDTVCTMVDRDAVVMYPPLAHALEAYVVEPGGVGGPEPFLAAAARAMGIGELRVIDTGLDPVTAEREQWDDGNNTLAIAPGRVIAYERNTETNARLADEGIEVILIAGSELGTGRGGPRCMSCPVLREALD